GREQRALLAVQELAELPRDRLVAQLRLLLLGEAIPAPRPPDADAHVGAEPLLGIDVDRPVEPRRRVPLVALRVLVETRQALAGRIVFPVVREALRNREQLGGLGGVQAIERG